MFIPYLTVNRLYLIVLLASVIGVLLALASLGVYLYRCFKEQSKAAKKAAQIDRVKQYNKKHPYDYRRIK